MKFPFGHKQPDDTKADQRLPLRSTIEVSLTILVIFLSSVLFFGIGSGHIDIKTIMISLLLTYIILQYWLGRIIRTKRRDKEMHSK